MTSGAIWRRDTSLLVTSMSIALSWSRHVLIRSRRRFSISGLFDYTRTQQARRSLILTRSRVIVLGYIIIYMHSYQSHTVVYFSTSCFCNSFSIISFFVCVRITKLTVVYVVSVWWYNSVAERRSMTSELPLVCA